MESIPFDSVRKRMNRPNADTSRPCPAWGRDADGEVWIRCTCGLPVTLDVPQTRVSVCVA
jgi:hypothetical protein